MTKEEFLKELNYKINAGKQAIFEASVAKGGDDYLTDVAAAYVLGAHAVASYLNFKVDWHPRSAPNGVHYVDLIIDFYGIKNAKA
jgi:hypothetical protein